MSAWTESLANIGNIQEGVHNFRYRCCPLYSNCSSVMQRYVIVVAYLGSQCTKFDSADFLHPFIRSCVFGMMRFCDTFDKVTASDFVQIPEKVLQRPWQWLVKRSGQKAWAIHGKSKLTETKKGETGVEQSQENAHHFLWHQEDCSQRIHPGWPSSQFCILLWCFMVTAWKCGKTLPSSPTQLFSVSLIEDKTERPPFWHNWVDGGRITDGAEHPHRTRLSGCI
jgi:hypothetical protein